MPGLRFVGGHFHEYQRLGDQVMAVFRDFTPLVERISIDEAFLDVAGAMTLFGSPIGIATSIRRRVKDEIGLPISIGVAGTKHLAKIASQVAKPDGLVVVPIGEEREFLNPLPVGLIWGVGAVTRTRLAGVGIRTIGELAETPNSYLRHLLGTAAGDKLSSLATNVDPRRIQTTSPRIPLVRKQRLDAEWSRPISPARPLATWPIGSVVGCARLGWLVARSRFGCGSPTCAQ